MTDPLNVFLGVDRFWRNAHGNDGSYSVLGNCPPVAESFFGQCLYRGHPYFRRPQFFRSGYVLPDLISSKEYEETQGRLRNEGECHHVMVHIVKRAEGFIEYGFATSKKHPGFESVYLNHLNLIGKFVEAFEVNGAKLIHAAQDHAVKIEDWIGPVYREKPQLPSAVAAHEKELQFLLAISGDQEMERCLQSLTKGERHVLRYYLSGSTTQDIAQMLFRSPRTIESHLENAKSKLGVHSRARLFEVLAPYHSFI